MMVIFNVFAGLVLFFGVLLFPFIFAILIIFISDWLGEIFWNN